MSFSKDVFMFVLNLFFFTFLLCEKSSRFVLGDDRLIRQECQVAAVPEACIKCLEFDPRSKQSTDVNIYLDILFDCMNNHAGVIQSDMSALAFSTIDASTKEVYTDCVDWLTCSKSDLFAASLGLKSGDVQTASNALYTALRYHDSCLRALQQTEAFKNGVPEQIMKDSKDYRDLYDAASKMIEQWDHYP